MPKFQGMVDYRHMFTGTSLPPSLLDLLEDYPSCKPSVYALIEHLPHLTPRYYSVASAPKDKTSVDFVFHVTELTTVKGKHRYGVCSRYLEKVSGVLDQEKSTVNQPRYISIFIRTTPNPFHFPPKLSQPLILICAGTGIAPFRSFLQDIKDRKLQENFNEISLHFGCREPTKDWFFKEEMLELQKEKILTEYFVSFSRDESAKTGKYVQDEIEKQGEIFVNKIMKEGAHIYVCG